MARQSAIAARRPAAHLPAVFAVAAPTAAPSSSPPRARATAGTSTDWGQALTVAGARCVEEPGPATGAPKPREAGLGRPEKHPAAYASPLRSAFLSAPHARKGRVPGRPRRALGLRSPASLLSPPVGPTGAFPRHCLTARRAAPRKRAELAYFRSGTPASPTPSALLPRLRRWNPAHRALWAQPRHLGKVHARLAAEASPGRRPADAMTKRSRRVRTLPPDMSRRSESDGTLVVDVGENPAAIQPYIRGVRISHCYKAEFSTGVPHFKQPQNRGHGDNS